MRILRLAGALIAIAALAGCEPGRPGAAAPAATAASSPPPTAVAAAATGVPAMTTRAPAAADRPPPPDVPPIVHKGVRYEQDMAGNEPPGSAPGGTLAAYDQAGGQRLWLLQVYTVKADPRGPSSHPGRYFRSMALVPGSDELEIEDEDGGQHRVDLIRRTARRTGGPPETSPPAPASTKPKPKP